MCVMTRFLSLLFCLFSLSRSLAGRLEATDISSVKKILAGLRLVETGLRLWQRLQQQDVTRVACGVDLSAAVAALSLSDDDSSVVHARSASAREDNECALLQESVSLLCERVCEAALQRAQANAASKEELIAVGVPGALSAVLALRAGLTRLCYCSLSCAIGKPLNYVASVVAC